MASQCRKPIIWPRSRRKKRLDDKRADIEKKVEDTLREGKKLEREIVEKLDELAKQAGEYLVRMPLAELKEKYRGHAKLLGYLDAVREHILKNLHRIKTAESGLGPAQGTPMQLGEPPSDPFLPYRINVAVDIEQCTRMVEDQERLSTDLATSSICLLRRSIAAGSRNVDGRFPAGAVALLRAPARI